MRCLILCLFIAFFSSGFSQELDCSTISSGRLEYQGDSIRMESTIGELSVEQKESGVYILSEGFEQPFFVQQWVMVDELKIHLSIYPNPAQNYIQVDADQYSNLYLEVFDIRRRIVLSHVLEDKETKVDISTLNQGTYFIRIQDDNSIIETFKLVKYD